MNIHILYSFVGTILGIISGCIFIISVLIDSPWAYVVAIVGSAAVSIMLRLTRIVNPNGSKGIVIGLVTGCLFCLLVIKRIDLPLFSARKNLWILTVIVFTQGIVRLFISDAQLANWYKPYSSAKDSNEIGP